MENKTLLLTLIKTELRNVKMISGLREAGFLGEDFYTDLVDPILELVGFTKAEINDDLHNFFFDLIEQNTKLPLEKFCKNTQVLALEVYCELLRKRMTC